MERALLITASIVGTWSVVYAAFWLHESGCMAAFTLACSNAPYEPLRAFVMLEWVAEYQSLIAGVLALLAGGAIFINSDRERNARRIEAKAEEAARDLSLMARLRAQCSTAALLAFNRASVEKIDGAIKTVELEAISIAEKHPELFRRIHTFVGFGRIRLNHADEAESEEEKRRMKRGVSAWMDMCSYALEAAIIGKDFTAPVEMTEAIRDGTFAWESLDEDDRRLLSDYILIIND